MPILHICIFLTHLLISQCRQSKSYGQGNQADLSGQIRVVTVVRWSWWSGGQVGQVGQDTQGGQGSQSGHLKALSSPFLTLSNAQTPLTISSISIFRHQICRLSANGEVCVRTRHRTSYFDYQT